MCAFRSETSDEASEAGSEIIRQSLRYLDHRHGGFMFDDGTSEYTTSEDEQLAYGERPSFIEDNGSYDSEDVPLRPWHTHGLVTDPGIDWEEADKNDKEIRLLQFYNRGNTKFSFMAFPIEKAPPYIIALSYTWGTDSPAQSVQIDGIQTPVRENLWEALSMIERKARHL